MENVLDVRTREAWREWLERNGATAKECHLRVKRGKPTDGELCYLDAVEEALCFGWIDSTVKKESGVTYQRFTPRKRGGLWTELNKARARRLIRLGRMTDAGMATLPDLDKDAFRPDAEVVQRLKEAGVYDTFAAFPPLYTRVRLYNVAFYKRIGTADYERTLRHLIEETRKGRLYGEWNDYGRLSDDE